MPQKDTIRSICKSIEGSYKMKLSRFRFYVSGENLLTLTKYTGYDPEIGGNVLGIDKGFYPQARSFIVGVNVQF